MVSFSSPMIAQLNPESLSEVGFTISLSISKLIDISIGQMYDNKITKTNLF